LRACEGLSFKFLCCRQCNRPRDLLDIVGPGLKSDVHWGFQCADVVVAAGSARAGVVQDNVTDIVALVAGVPEPGDERSAHVVDDMSSMISGEAEVFSRSSRRVILPRRVS
jgi:hypothetical protein